jgi:hypothetical protein
MPGREEVPKEAIEAAKQKWRLVAELPRHEPEADARGVSDDYRERADEENNHAISQVLQAAAPAIRNQERQRIQEALLLLAITHFDPSGECPTCGSDDPRLVNATNRRGKPARFVWTDASILSDERRAHWHCPDAFHDPSGEQGEEAHG